MPNRRVLFHWLAPMKHFVLLFDCTVRPKIIAAHLLPDVRCRKCSENRCALPDTQGPIFSYIKYEMVREPYRVETYLFCSSSHCDNVCPYRICRPGSKTILGGSVVESCHSHPMSFMLTPISLGTSKTPVIVKHA